MQWSSWRRKTKHQKSLDAILFAVYDESRLVVLPGSSVKNLKKDKFCRDEKNAMYQIAQGYSQAIHECADKFAGNEQWQCSTKTVKNKSKGKKRNEMDITLNEGKMSEFLAM